MANIKIEKINKYFDANHVVKDVSLDIKSGSFTVIVGPSGCGKSTILRMIAGLEEINSGSIFIDDAQVNDLSPKDRYIAMVFQSYAIFPHLNVGENVAFGLRRKKLSIEEKKVKVKDSYYFINITKIKILCYYFELIVTIKIKDIKYEYFRQTSRRRHGCKNCRRSKIRW